MTGLGESLPFGLLFSVSVLAKVGLEGEEVSFNKDLHQTFLGYILTKMMKMFFKLCLSVCIRQR